MDIKALIGNRLKLINKDNKEFIGIITDAYYKNKKINLEIMLKPTVHKINMKDVLYDNKDKSNSSI